MNRSTNPYERIKDRIRLDSSGCWNWCGVILRTGYGQIKYKYRQHLAHRFVYQLFCGPIATGKHLHHTCHNTKCVNPSHLLEVTPRENLMADDTPARRNILKRFCPRGHQYDYVNKGHRQCTQCKAIWQRRKRAVLAAKKVA